MKKSCKAVFSLVLMLLIVMSLSSTAFAAAPSITFKGFTSGFDFQPAPVHAVRRAQGEYAYSGTFRVPPMSVCFYQHVRSNPEK